MLLDPGYGVMKVLDLLTRVDLVASETILQRSADKIKLKGCGVRGEEEPPTPAKNT